MVGKVESYILRQIDKMGGVYIPLLDPEKITPNIAASMTKICENNGAQAIMVGGSTFVSSSQLDDMVQKIKKAVNIPVILFPNNITGLSSYADAVWFMSLLNSSDPYFITGAQVLSAPLIKKFELEAIPLGYLIVGDGGAAAVIGKAHPIPYNRPELTVAHALAAEYLGMRFIYLEGGSGVRNPVPTQMVKMVKKMIDVHLIVGGGIKNGNQAKELVEAGADIIVTGNVLEKTNIDMFKNKIIEIVEGIRIGSKKDK